LCHIHGKGDVVDQEIAEHNVGGQTYVPARRSETEDECFTKSGKENLLLVSCAVEGVSERDIFNEDIGDVDRSAALCSNRNTMRPRAAQALDMQIGARRANGNAVVAIGDLRILDAVAVAAD
jgi:hypothetical protein